jgi:hypothetical protein
MAIDAHTHTDTYMTTAPCRRLGNNLSGKGKKIQL